MQQLGEGVRGLQQLQCSKQQRSRQTGEEHEETEQQHPQQEGGGEEEEVVVAQRKQQNDYEEENREEQQQQQQQDRCHVTDRHQGQPGSMMTHLPRGSSVAAACSYGQLQLPGLMAVPEVKVEAMGASGRYLQLAQQPFEASELARLRSHYMEPYVIKVQVDSATRSGAMRRGEKQRRCKPRLQQFYTGQLWQRVVQLAQEAGVAAGSLTGANPAPAQLLWWLRCIEHYEQVCHKERMPQVLQRFATVEAGASGNGGGVSGGEVMEVEIVDLISEDEEEVEAWLLANGGCVVVGEKQAPAGPGSRALQQKAAVRIKLEPGGDEEGG